MGATGPGFEGPALFTAITIKKIITKTTTTATSPQSKNCCSPSYKSRALQRLSLIQAIESEELRHLQRRRAVLLTITGQHQLMT